MKATLMARMRWTQKIALVVGVILMVLAVVSGATIIIARRLHLGIPTPDVPNPPSKPEAIYKGWPSGAKPIEPESVEDRVKNPGLKFEVGDRINFVLPNGKIEEGVVKAVFETTAGPRLNVAFGAKGDLSASVGARQVIGKLPPVN
jgi:hypothetical protein